jgi:hypothetical protein
MLCPDKLIQKANNGKGDLPKKVLTGGGVPAKVHKTVAFSFCSFPEGNTNSEKSEVASQALIERAGEINALVAADSVPVARQELRWIASETSRFLDTLARDVRECKNVMLASQYARWLQFSGLLKVIERGLGSDLIRKQVDDLLYECGELFRCGKHDPKYAASDIAEINRKLDLLLGHGRDAVHCSVVEEIYVARLARGVTDAPPGLGDGDDG